MNQQGDLKGVYQKSQIINGRNSWKTASSAIWYSSKEKEWVIDSLENIGTSVFIFTTYVFGRMSAILYMYVLLLSYLRHNLPQIQFKSTFSCSTKSGKL